MRASPYNNPLFAEGLANLVKGYLGNPYETARSELLAAQARNENLTADYRQAMDVGLEGDLSSMMIRALQAGSQYSGNAPRISSAVLQNNAGTLGATGGGGGGGTGLPPEVLAEARAAIAAGADPNAVYDRLRLLERYPGMWGG